MRRSDRLKGRMLKNLNGFIIVRGKEGLDIFEKLKNVLGCEVISDLKYMPYSSRAKILIHILDLEEYSFEELNDLATYFYGEMLFTSKEEVICFLKS